MGSSSSDPLDVTVVTPAYNRSSLITRALDSVRTQTHLPSEIIVIDDASTDDTVKVAQRWAEKHRFPLRVEALRENRGPAVARNRGMELATTRYIAFLDSDDEHLPNTLAQLVAPLEAFPDVVLSFADATTVLESTRETHGQFAPYIDIARAAIAIPGGGNAQMFRLKDASHTLLKASIIPTCSTCFRRDAALAVGGMPNFRSGEDWLFWLRLAEQGAFVFQLDDLALCHRHDDNTTHPRSAEIVAREKLRAIVELLDGTLGVILNDEQRTELRALLPAVVWQWRYHLSRLGLNEYFAGLRRHASISDSTPLQHCLMDPKSLLRAIYCSFR